jgi:ATP/maltotriose-dependent transcriptional regulator MalT
MDGASEKSAPRQRRIVARPRLTSALDSSNARLRMLIASAGYGKTTLAEQWTADRDRRTTWYRTQEASADVAVLAVGLAAAAAEIIPGCDRRLRERLTATSSPSEEATVLAAMLAEDVAGWPADAWLVIDDYHLLDVAQEAESFVETLVTSAPVNVLVASRRRPTWASSRKILYGDIFELGQAALAMNPEEAKAVLEGWRSEQASGLIALAEGWPAVIGLAGILPLPADPEGDMPAALYEFFAEEVFQALAPAVRAGLGVIAVAPALDRELVATLIDGAAAENVLESGLRTGIIEERGGRIELHPLARQFLDSRTAGELVAERAAAVDRCREIYRSRRDWDALFSLLERHGLEAELELLLEEALDELLSAARLSTVEKWLARAEHAGYTAPIYRVAGAELSLRGGRHVAARTLAESVARNRSIRPDLRYRAFMIAAEAAHVAAREEDALALFRDAEAAGVTRGQAREALWGQLMCMAELELDDAEVVLNDLAASVPSDDAQEIVKEAGRRIGLELRFGHLKSLTAAREKHQLIPHVRDAFVRTSFRSVFATALNLSADYSAALDVALEMIGDAKEHWLDFALPYGYAAAAAANAGLRDYKQAEEYLTSADLDSRRMINLHAETNAHALRLRVLLQQGRVEEACVIAPAYDRAPLRGLHGELIASSALALGCAGRFEEARALVDRVRNTTRAIEPRVLIHAVDAVVALKSGGRGARAQVELLLDEALSTGGLDLLVTSYRASPELLSALLTMPATRERCWSVLGRAGDTDWVNAAGFEAPSQRSSSASLSKREREVHDLMCAGLKYRQIAECLFISEATVKVHVQHIFDKLGVRSRTALAVSAALHRSGQAAGAATTTATSSSEDDTSLE